MESDSEARRAARLRSPRTSLVAAYRVELPDVRDEDVLGSPFFAECATTSWTSASAA
jgi:hypothetical protein